MVMHRMCWVVPSNIFWPRQQSAALVIFAKLFGAVHKGGQEKAGALPGGGSKDHRLPIQKHGGNFFLH